MGEEIKKFKCKRCKEPKILSFFPVGSQSRKGGMMCIKCIKEMSVERQQRRGYTGESWRDKYRTQIIGRPKG